MKTYPTYSVVNVDLPEVDSKGVYHKVKKGETLWRIALAYDVPISEIIRINNIPNVAQIEVNQLVLIPGADEVKDIVVDAEEDKDEFIWPVKGKVIRYFHQREGSLVNKGIDIKVSAGEVVKASRTGRVVFADYLSGYGQTVILDHQDGFYSIYSQNKKLLVKLGDLAIKSKEIAKVGKIQDNACLHFEIRKNDVEHNPLYYLP